METKEKQHPPTMMAEPQSEHEWLHKLIGQWTYEAEMTMAPDQPTEKCKGVESVRAIGGLWVVGEGKGEMPGGGEATMIITLGFDPRTKRYVGTWIGSMMTHMWIYDGVMDAAGKELTLYSEGPDMAVENRMARYKDVITFQSDDHRVLTSHAMDEEGRWHPFMRADYRRRR
jgi:hypothetical protein